MQFAKDTSVSVEKSRSEIEAVCRRYGASGFMSAWKGRMALIEFEMKDRRVRFILPLPDQNDKAFTHYRHNSGKMVPRQPDKIFADWEQACRQRWRALLLCIKAKLEAVETHISEFDDEFLSHLILPSGLTLGETLRPRLSEICSTGSLPPLLPGPIQ